MNCRFSKSYGYCWGEGITLLFLTTLSDAIERVGPGFGMFRVYIGDGASEASINRLKRLQDCSVEPFGSSYANSLCQSKAAIILGGYNSLVDILALRIPALVVLRNMRDREQQEHLEALRGAQGTRLSVIDERGCTSDIIHQNLLV